MIPDIAVMLAVYMCARLLRAAVTATEVDPSGEGRAKAKFGGSICNVVDILAIVAIIYFAYHVNTLGSQATKSLGGDSDDAARQGAANTNARALATAVQGKAITDGKYDSNLADYAKDLGGSIPTNPCTGTDTGYTITVTVTTARVAAVAGSNCGSWTPMEFSLTL
jgi:hypothetical protein